MTHYVAKQIPSTNAWGVFRVNGELSVNVAAFSGENAADRARAEAERLMIDRPRRDDDRR